MRLVEVVMQWYPNTRQSLCARKSCTKTHLVNQDDSYKIIDFLRLPWIPSQVSENEDPHVQANGGCDLASTSWLSNAGRSSLGKLSRASSIVHWTGRSIAVETSSTFAPANPFCRGVRRGASQGSRSFIASNTMEGKGCLCACP
jgi:hypothetical protein